MAKEKIEHRYIFPNFLASAMKNLDMKTQMEAGMMSMVMLLIGMMLMSVYSVLYLSQGWVFKTLLIFNLVAGFIFMSGYLVTTYQQYISYMAAVSVQEVMGHRIHQKPPKNRKNQFLFFGGFILFGMSLFSIITVKFSLYITIPTIIIGILMMAAVFLKPKKNVYIDYTQKLQQDTNEVGQDYQLEQEESGMADILANSISQQEALRDQEILEQLAEEEKQQNRKAQNRQAAKDYIYNPPKPSKPMAQRFSLQPKVILYDKMKGGQYRKENGRRLPR